LLNISLSTDTLATSMSDGESQVTQADADVMSRRLENPRSIRALAHPARLAILDALSTGKELTATECAELTGLSPSATAYHLKSLEHYGMVETASLRADKRQRPWRATGRGTQMDLDASTPASASAAAAVVAALMDATRTVAVEFTEAGYAEPEEWQDAVLNNSDLWLTAEEFHRIAKELEAVLKPYQGRQPDARPADSRQVKVMSVVVPHRRAGPDAGG
jgi:DNA-binding transcriptional ArsR family regulator